MPDIRQKMNNTTIVLVDIPKSYDYSFTQYEIKTEPVPFRSKVTKAFDLDVISCETLDETFHRVERAQQGAPTRHFTYLVHEDLFQDGLFEKLDKLLYVNDVWAQIRCGSYQGPALQIIIWGLPFVSARDNLGTYGAKKN